MPRRIDLSWGFRSSGSPDRRLRPVHHRVLPVLDSLWRVDLQVVGSGARGSRQRGLALRTSHGVTAEREEEACSGRMIPLRKGGIMLIMGMEEICVVVWERVLVHLPHRLPHRIDADAIPHVKRQLVCTCVIQDDSASFPCTPSGA
jgi:hypothetical protein